MTGLISRQAAIDAVEMLDETDDVKNFVRNRLLAVNGDIIDRQDAIDAFCEGKCDYCYPGGCDLFRTIKAVESVPSAQQWIPCSERLPSEDGRYLVSYWLMKDMPWISVMYYGKPTFPEKDHPCFYVSDGEYDDVEYDDIVAWMPLPEPYRKTDPKTERGK